MLPWRSLSDLSSTRLVSEARMFWLLNSRLHNTFSLTLQILCLSDGSPFYPLNVTTHLKRHTQTFRIFPSCLHVSLSVSVSVSLSLSIYLSKDFRFYYSFPFSITHTFCLCLSVCLSACFYLSIYLSIYLS